MILFPLLRRFLGSVQVCYVSFGMAILGYGVLFVMLCAGVDSLAALLVPAFFIFAAFGVLTVLTTVFLANTVDYGELKNHRRDESVIFSMQTFVVKLASGVAALLASICLSVCNLSSDTAAVQTASASSVLVLRMTMAVLPMLGLAAALWVFHKKYRLTEAEVARIAGELKGARE
jgi:melibiose permease